MTSYFAKDDYRAKNYDVFISYKREDDHAREVLVLALELAGYEVFWDAKLNNDDWKGELRDEINRCKLVICLWSAKAAASEYVKAEAYHAFGREEASVGAYRRRVGGAGVFQEHEHPSVRWLG